MRVMKLQWSPINPPFKMPTDPPHSPSGSMISSSMLIHFWEARKNVKGGPCIFLEIEMLMIDEEGTLAQGFIGQNLRNQYEKELERGSIYTLTKFYASNSKVMYHVADQKLVICISHVSALSKVEENIEGILTERFRSIHFQILKPTAISEGIFTMLLATLSWSMVSLSISVRFCAPRMTQLLGELCGPVMNIYLWDEAAENFCLKFDACAATPTVLLITTVNPKRLGGKLRLSSMSYSRVFLDEEVDSPKEYLTWLTTNLSATSSVNPVEVVKAETLTISEIAAFIKRQPAKYILITCPLNNYRVAMSVYDNEEQFTFIILRDAGKEFTGRKAIELIDTYVEENGGDGTELEVPLPQCFIDTKGQTKKFRIKVAHYNFTSTRLSLTATRIVSSAVLLPKNPPLNTPPIPLSTTQNSRAATEVEISDVAESSGGGSPYANDRPTSATDDQKKPKRIKRCG
uniref:Replication factor A C-terminal domain-containing protein n=1 Tax=Brassica campestris TaxID=3711 RepID=A0A3P6C2U1_BRACM|nr:unnamed protein product [Brassica rapa]